jgi:hypothetical protein
MSRGHRSEPPPDSTLIPQQNETNGIQRQLGEQVFAMEMADEQHFLRNPLFTPIAEFSDPRVSSESDSAALAPLQQEFYLAIRTSGHNLTIIAKLNPVRGSLRERSPGVWQVAERDSPARVFDSDPTHWGTHCAASLH